MAIACARLSDSIVGTLKRAERKLDARDLGKGAVVVEKMGERAC